MESIGYYLRTIIKYAREGIEFLLYDKGEITASHLVAFLLAIVVIWLLSYIVAKLFKLILKVIIVIALLWLLYMLIFDRSKYNELFGKKGDSGSSSSN